ncbi:Cytochrome c class I [Paraburkholderia ribeironis]|uniref:Cytochrome c class I n=1 Tax=Paraburkholderia ribeironis TaxID=1247936 RepID=A0A1N7RLZ8_9BURK|nr:c-type cytochrome [Paraburkholderia ribeironis]SIT36113.1 Cytochrome c class I [Paraburkholderia ribeironis]
MNEERVFSLRNPWFTWSVGGTIAIAIVGILIGFIWLPSASSAFGDLGLWAKICGAAGTPSSWYSGNNAVSPVPSEVVVLPPSGRVHADADSIGRGATLATQHCSMCHGVLGTVQVTAPALAGQYADVIYKELRDYQTGQRPSAVMQPIIAPRSDQDLRDLAAYYASLTRAPAAEPLPAGEGPDATAVKLAMQGDPQRNIPPCAACHGQLDRKGAAPWLGGQSSIYLAAQMRAFASGARHNDINEQMRIVARQMTPEEIDSIAKYYSAMR